MSELRRYRKKPVIIEAMRFEDSSECVLELQEFIGTDTLRVSYKEPIPRLWVDTLEGGLWATEGDYIIKGTQGEFYPCKPDIFAEIYEEAPA